MIDKEIYKLYLAVTTRCNLRCRYCFVRKTGQTMSLATAKSAVELLLASPGRQKLLLIYGGEPLLYPELVKAVIRYAQARAAAAGKGLRISLGTNGILLDAAMLLFLRAHNVGLSISLDGGRDIHDQGRKFPNGRGAFDRLARNLPKIFSSYPERDISALCGVHPKNADRFHESVQAVKAMGFRSINIEPIEGRDMLWDAAAIQALSDNMLRIIGDILRNANRGDFFFLNSINRELRGRYLSHPAKKGCPFWQSLQVYPRGDMAFSPFLINTAGNQRYVVGNVRGGFIRRYAACRHRPGRPDCGKCWDAYTQGAEVHSGPAIAIRDSYSIQTARYLSGRGQAAKCFSPYIQEAKRRIFE